MKRWSWKRIVGVAFLVLFLGAGAWIANVIWGKPGNIDHFFERAFMRLALKSPELLTQIGILESIGLGFHNSKLDDASDDFALAMLEQQKGEMQVMRSYDRASLTPQQQMSLDIADYFFDGIVRGEKYRFHNYPVNQLFGVQNTLPAFMLNTHPVRKESDANRYNDRLEQFGVKLGQVVEGLKNRESKGILPPRFVIEQVTAGLKGFVAPPPRENALYTGLRDKLAKLPDIGETERQSILARTEKAIAEVVYPAYRNLIAWHEGALARATTDDGVWKLPDGAGYYAWQLRTYTTTEMGAEELHQLGLREVARIDAEMRAALAQVGLTGKSVGEHLSDLAKDPKQHYPDNSPETRKQVLADFQKILDEVNEKITPAFRTRPKGGLAVQAVEPFREKTAAAAFYQAGTLDGSRKGIFFANLRDVVKEVPKFGMKTVSYHEGIPGHYFQIAIAQEQKNVPMFRRILPFIAYSEGWALYSEKLAYEQGMYKDDPHGNLGRLQWELFRAARLVVDTGIHHKRWTREQAIDYMERTTGVARTEVVSEVERYIVLPGQATSYKVGELKILELRERAKQALGPKFDLGKFHDAVLREGSMPLTLLERKVDRFIAESK